MFPSNLFSLRHVWMVFAAVLWTACGEMEVAPIQQDGSVGAMDAGAGVDPANDAGADPCAGQDCSGHGRCAVLDDGTPLCACEPGYAASGLSCEPLVGDDPCDGVDCSGRGQCAAFGDRSLT